MFICRQLAPACTQPLESVQPWGTSLSLGPWVKPYSVLITDDGEERQIEMMTLTLVTITALVYPREADAVITTYPFYR